MLRARLAGVVRVVAAALARVPQRDAPGLGRHEHHLGAPAEQAPVHEPVHDKDGRDGAGRVHALLLFPVGSLVRAQVLGGKVPGRDHLSLSGSLSLSLFPARVDHTYYRVQGLRRSVQEAAGELLPHVGLCGINAGDPFDLFGKPPGTL